MKKVFKIFVALIFILLVTFICYEAYVIFVQDLEKQELEEQAKIQEQENEQEEIIADGPIFTLDNYPKVDASLATQPLTDAFIEEFTGEENITEEYLDYTNTHPAYLRLIDKEVI